MFTTLEILCICLCVPFSRSIIFLILNLTPEPLQFFGTPCNFYIMILILDIILFVSINCQVFLFKYCPSILTL